MHIKAIIHFDRSWGITLGLKSLGSSVSRMNLNLNKKVLLEHWMICILSKQDGSVVVEEDEMKSIDSPYSTQSI